MQRKYKKMPANILSIMQTNKNRQSSHLALPLSLSFSLTVAAAASAYTINSWKHAARAGAKGGAYDNHITHTTRQPHKHSLVKCSTHTYMHAYFYCLCVWHQLRPSRFPFCKQFAYFQLLFRKGLMPHIIRIYASIRLPTTRETFEGYQQCVGNPLVNVVRYIYYIYI